MEFVEEFSEGSVNEGNVRGKRCRFSKKTEKCVTAHRRPYTRIKRKVQVRNFRASSMQPRPCSTYLPFAPPPQEIFDQPG